MTKLAGLCAGAILALVAAPALAQTAPEVFIGGFAHDVDTGISATPHEDGTSDVELGARTKRYDYWGWLKLNYYVKAQINTDDRSNFYTIGFEFRKHLFRPQFYIGAGLGLSYDDGVRAYRNPFDPGISVAEQNRRLYIERNYKAMGSDFLFNPNILVGYEITPHWAVEGAWDHYSHATILGNRNPGMDNFGGRLVYRFGAR